MCRWWHKLLLKWTLVGFHKMSFPALEAAVVARVVPVCLQPRNHRDGRSSEKFVTIQPGLHHTIYLSRNLISCWHQPTFAWWCHLPLPSLKSPSHLLPFHLFPPTSPPPSQIFLPPSQPPCWTSPPLSKIPSPIFLPPNHLPALSTQASPPQSPPSLCQPPLLPVRGFTPTGWVDHLYYMPKIE